ncbi:MAG: DEAD/DEAH box helicase [Beijerinckiaceae bacterium]
MQPRDYQEACDAHLWAYLHNQPGKNPLVVMATGLGKSMQMAMAKWRLLHNYPYLRILNLTHVKELVEGNYKALRRLWPRAPAGVYSAGLGIKDARNQITFCGIQSVAKRPATFGKIDFVFIDEAHRMSPEDAATYGKFLTALKAVNPNLIIIGFTATDYRMKGGRLTDMGLFDDVVFDIGSGESFVWAIDNGYLSRPVPADPGFEIDDSKIHLLAGEYKEGEASQAWEDQNILERAVDLMIALGEEQNRKSWISFCQSIENAELVADMFRYKGYAFEAVHSKRSDRDEVLKVFKEGGLRGVSNKDVLTTGFDHPPIDLIGMKRLTRSPGLWVQMCGRGTRPVYAPGFDITTLQGRLDAILASDKQNCLVLDFAGNTKRLGAINYPRVPGAKKKGGGEQPVRTCKQCNPHTYHHPSVKICPHCSFIFPPPETIKAIASTQSLVLDLKLPPPMPEKITVEGVHQMICSLNEGKAGKKDTMRVDYICGYNRFSTWVCFEHDAKTFPRIKAEEWWRAHGGLGPAPYSIEEALEQSESFRKPKFIRVKQGQKFNEVTQYDFIGTRFELPPELGGPPLADPDPDPKVAERPALSKAEKELKDMLDDEIPF